MNKDGMMCGGEPALPLAGIPEYNGENFRTEMFKEGGWLAMEGNRPASQSEAGKTGAKSSHQKQGNGGIGILSASMNHPKMGL